MHHVSCLFHKPPIYIAASETNKKQQDRTTFFNENEVGPLKYVLISVILGLHLYI